MNNQTKLVTAMSTIVKGLTPIEKKIFTETVSHLATDRDLEAKSKTDIDKQRYRNDIHICERILMDLRYQEHDAEMQNFIFNASEATGVILRGIIEGLA